MDRPVTHAARSSRDLGRAERAGSGRAGAGAESQVGRPGAQSQARPAEQQPHAGLHLLPSSAFDSLGLASGTLSSRLSHARLGFAGMMKAPDLAFVTDT